MSLPVARVGNTRIYLHITFILVALVLAFSGFSLQLAVFAGSLIFHELGHIMSASLMGAEITRVEFWPFGASARLERTWQLTPTADSLVAFAGPFNSGILASAASAVQRCLSQTYGASAAGAYPLLDLLVKVNLGLFLMNIIPCLPLDGGRIARSKLALKLGYVEASKKMAAWGLVAGAVMTGAGLFGLTARMNSLALVIVGPLVIWGALDEGESAARQNVMEILTRTERLRQRRAIPVEEILVPSDATVAEVVSRLVPSRYNMILVAGRNMKVLGRVTETRLLEAFYKGDTHLCMRDLWERIKPE